MVVGVPRETKADEHRVGLLPSGAYQLIQRGHRVLVEKDAGIGSFYLDSDYAEAGAQLVDTPAVVFEQADLIVKVKEPQPEEIAMLREGQVLFTYLHLAPDPDQTKGLLASGATAIAYETVTDNFGGLPLLAPMSEVAGRMSIQAGARCLEMYQGGRGALLGGVAGVPAADVLILGGGVVGSNAANLTLVLGATALVHPVVIGDGLLRQGVLSCSSVICFALLVQNDVTRVKGVVLAVALLAALYMVVRMGGHLAEEEPLGGLGPKGAWEPLEAG